MVERRLGFAVIPQPESWAALLSGNNIFLSNMFAPPSPHLPPRTPNSPPKPAMLRPGFWEGEPGPGPTGTKEGRRAGDISSSPVWGTVLDTEGKGIERPLDTGSVITLNTEVSCPCSIQNTRRPNSHFQPQVHPFCYNHAD